MRDRNLFLPSDVNELSDQEEKIRVFRLCGLWEMLDSEFTGFRNNHIENKVKSDSPYEAFFTCYAGLKRNYRKARKKNDTVLLYLIGSRLSIYEFLLDVYKQFMPVYEARFEADFYDKVIDLAIFCGQICQMMHLSIKRRLDEGEYYFQHHSALQRGGAKKSAASNKAKFFIQSEWAKHQQDYQNNKSAFARHYSRRIKNELGTDVTEKTIREVWLTGTPATSKQAG